MTLDLSRGTAATDLLRGASPLSAPVAMEAAINNQENLDWADVWALAKERLYTITKERGTDMDGTALMCLWVDGMLAAYRTLGFEAQQLDRLREAARHLIAEGVMSSGSGQASTPTFDEHDRATQPKRWYVVNAEHFDALKVELAALAVKS